jgi:hypothetical protein
MNTSADRVNPYDNFSALSDAHEQLLVKQHEGSPVATMMEDVSGFIERARETGILLYTSDQRSVAQAFIDYWTAMIYRAGGAADQTNLVRFDERVFPALSNEQCPYVGLEAFREWQSHLFFGRSRLIDALAQRMTKSRFIAVLGPSGSGKSSLVTAGLLPLLRKGGPDNHGAWNVLPVIVPGATPLQSLAAIIRREDETLAGVARQLKSDAKLLRIRLEESSPLPACLVVDQFEELFSLCIDYSARRAFVEALLTLTSDAGRDHTVIVTMRSDWEDSVSQYPRLHERFLNEVRVGSLLDEELRDVIERPAEQVGLKFEPGLVERLVEDTRGEAAALPLLQFTLLKLWDARNRNRLTHESYNDLGNVRFALSNCADKLSRTLRPETADTMRRIFLRLVRPANGVEVVRKRVRRLELAQGESRERFDYVLGELRRAGLVRYTPADPDNESQIEIPHETLVRNWRRLRDWIDEERANMATRERLERGAYQWLMYGRQDGYLDEALIPGALAWLDSTAAADLGVTELIAEYVRSSADEAKRRRNHKVRVAVNRIAMGAALLIILITAAAVAIIKDRDRQNTIVEANMRAARQTAAAQQARAEAETARRLKELAEADKRAFLQKKENELAELLRSQKISELEMTRTNLENQLRGVLQRNETLEREAVVAQRELRGARGSVRELETANTRLVGELNTVREQFASATAANRQLDSVIESLRSEQSTAISLPLPPEDQGVRVGGVISTARSNTARGAICCMVRDDSGRRYILTLATVLAGHPGDLVIQPARDGRGHQRIGIMWKAGKDPLRSGALALPLPGVAADRTIPQRGRFRGTEDDPETQPNVEMVGPGGIRSGRVLRATDEKVITSIRGTAADIGAPVFNTKRELIGVIGSIENEYAIVWPIDPILRELDVRLE